MKAQKINEKYFGYKNEIEFAVETLPDKELKEAIKECNRNGVPVKGFCTTLELGESAIISLRITKENVKRIFNILKNVDKLNCLKIVISYDEQENIEMIKILANLINKSRVFSIIKSSVSDKCNIEELSPQLQELYRMHKMLTSEDMSHQIQYTSGRFLQSAIFKNIDSYFSYGADRVRNVYNSLIFNATDYSFKYRLKSKRNMLNKMKQINYGLDKEFKWQEAELEELSKKYRYDTNDRYSDMFERLAKVRDEYGYKNG